MAFTATNDLERALIKAAGDPAFAANFYRDLAKSEIFIIRLGYGRGAAASTLPTGTSVDIRAVEFNKKQCIPFFSSLTRLQASVTHRVSYLRMKAIDFLELTKGSYLVLNPGSDYGKEFSPEEAEAIANGSIWRPSDRRIVQQQRKVTIGEPALYPTEFAEALVRLFKNKPQVTRAWLARILAEGDVGSPHTLIAVDAVERFDEVSAEIGIVCRGVNVPEPPVEVLQMTTHGGLSDYFRERKPFYRQKLWTW